MNTIHSPEEKLASCVAKVALTSPKSQYHLNVGGTVSPNCIPKRIHAFLKLDKVWVVIDKNEKDFRSEQGNVIYQKIPISSVLLTYEARPINVELFNEYCASLKTLINAKQPTSSTIATEIDSRTRKLSSNKTSGKAKPKARTMSPPRLSRVEISKKTRKTPNSLSPQRRNQSIPLIDKSSNLSDDIVDSGCRQLQIKFLTFAQALTSKIIDRQTAEMQQIRSDFRAEIFSLKNEHQKEIRKIRCELASSLATSKTPRS